MSATARALNRYDLLKVVALVALTIGHLGAYLFPDAEWMRIIGRIAAPSFLFLVGFNQSYTFRWPLLIAAIIVSIGEGVMQGYFSPQNILWTVLVGRFVLQLLERHAVGALPILLACAVWYVPGLFVLDGSTLALVWMLFGRAMRRAPQSGEALLYGAIGFFGAAWQPMVFYDWSWSQNMMTVALLAAWWWGVLWRFKVVPARHDVAWLRYWSRQSLAYYVLHKMVLVAASVY